jgi:Na+-driven multidrug efflux pump
MSLISMAFFLIGFQITGSAMFQALGKARPAFLLSLSRQVLLLIPLVLILPGFLGTKGVWISFPLADSGSFLLTLYLFRRELLNLAVSGPVAGD